MKYVHLDDHASLAGGTHLTSMAFLEDRMDDVESVVCAQLTFDHIENFKDRLWIIGNIMGLYRVNPDTVTKLLTTCDFVKIEFDYNYCEARGDKPHEHLLKCKCECPHGITGKSVIAQTYNLINQYAKHIFFMSERQRAIFSSHMPTLPFSRSSVLTSAFTKEALDLLQKYRRLDDNGKYAILAGNGGWHSKAKGTDEAVNYCVANNLDYEVLPNQPYHDHIRYLSGFKGIVFLPIIDDTCPRCIIEAKLLGLEVITNTNSQHVTEDWWNKDINSVRKYITGRPQYFWNTIDGLSI